MLDSLRPLGGCEVRGSSRGVGVRFPVILTYCAGIRCGGKGVQVGIELPMLDSAGLVGAGLRQVGGVPMRRREDVGDNGLGSPCWEVGGIGAGVDRVLGNGGGSRNGCTLRA